MEQRHYSKTPVKTPYLETGNIPIRFILMISEETSKLERWIEIIESAKRKKKQEKKKERRKSVNV